MAHGLGIRVVAEGVESFEQASLLRGERVRRSPGFLHQPPVPAPNFPAWSLRWISRMAPLPRRRPGQRRLTR